MHLGKTKAKFNSHAKPSPVIVDGKIIEEVDSYVYLGKYIPRDGTLFPEVKRRFVQPFEEHIASREFPSLTIETKRKLFNEYVLLAMTYRSETWGLNTTTAETFAVA